MAERRKSCRQCAKSATASRPISRRGLCPACAKANLIGNNRALSTGGIKGDPEARRRWLEAMARAVERESAKVGGGA